MIMTNFQRMTIGIKRLLEIIEFVEQSEPHQRLSLMEQELQINEVWSPKLVRIRLKGNEWFLLMFDYILVDFPSSLFVCAFYEFIADRYMNKQIIYKKLCMYNRRTSLAFLKILIRKIQDLEQDSSILKISII